MADSKHSLEDKADKCIFAASAAREVGDNETARKFLEKAKQYREQAKKADSNGEGDVSKLDAACALVDTLVRTPTGTKKFIPSSPAKADAVKYDTVVEWEYRDRKSGTWSKANRQFTDAGEAHAFSLVRKESPDCRNVTMHNVPRKYKDSASEPESKLDAACAKLDSLVRTPTGTKKLIPSRPAKADAAGSRGGLGRLISTVNGTAGTVKVYYNVEWEEYSCRIAGNENATYFTDDKSDALSTAKVMSNDPRGFNKRADAARADADADRRGPSDLSNDDIAMKIRSTIGPQGQVLSAKFDGYAQDGSARYNCKVLVDQNMRVWVEKNGRVSSK